MKKTLTFIGIALLVIAFGGVTSAAAPSSINAAEVGPEIENTWLAMITIPGELPPFPSLVTNTRGVGHPARARPESSAEPARTTIPYAGRLSNEAGQPVADGAYDLAFTLHNTIAGGEPLWSEVQDGVAVKGGSFAVSLGRDSLIPPALLDGRSLWLAVGVRGPQETEFTALSPRQQISAFAPSSPAADAACPHDHFGESWIGDSPGYGLMLQNNSGAGMRVETAGTDGVYVNEAGHPATTTPSNFHNGFEVAGAEGSGLWVGHADLDGVSVNSAEWYGLYVVRADYDGVRVDSAGHNGVFAASSSAGYYGGKIYNYAAGGAGLYTAGGDNSAPDLVLGVHGSGDDGRIYSDPGYTGSDLLLFSNDEAQIHLDEDNNSDSSFIIYNGANTAVWTVSESGAVTLGAEAGAYGPRATYAVQATGDWIEDFGTTELVNGQATVTIEPVFAQMVNLDQYQVFLTPLGNCQLYISDKTPASFTVKSMGEQRCDISFDYRLVARRLGNEAARLEPAEVSRDE